MRYRFIEVEKAMYPVTMLCRVLRVSRSGFYAWQQRPISPRAEETRRLDIEIKKLFEASKRRSGSPKITRAPGRRGLAGGQESRRTAHARVGSAVDCAPPFQGDDQLAASISGGAEPFAA